MGGLSRREVLKVAGVATMASLIQPLPAASGLLDRFLGPTPEAKPTPPITPNDEFYVTSYRSPPTVRLDSWELKIHGLVNRPLTMTYSEILARPSVIEIVTLECVGNTVGGEFISTALWEGVRLKALFEEVGISSRAYDIVFRAADGYSDSITLNRAMAGDVLVAYRMNGVPLPQGHGFPVRIIVPGVYGMKSVQWLTDIEVVDQDYLGYYQKKGWTDDATVKTMSRIDLPEHGMTLKRTIHVVQGLAFAGVRGIQGVEISTDEEATWQQARLEQPLSPSSWVFWKWEWHQPKTGRHTLTVRATDGSGRPQSSDEREASPDGATGLHQVTVTVEV